MGYLDSINKALGGVPGDIYQTVTGHPDAIKAAYDKAIADSRAGGNQIRDFLLQREGKAQQFYAPVQGMFTSAYGSKGIQPVMDQGGSVTPFQSAFGGAPGPGLGSRRP